MGPDLYKKTMHLGVLLSMIRHATRKAKNVKYYNAGAPIQTTRPELPLSPVQKKMVCNYNNCLAI